MRGIAPHLSKITGRFDKSATEMMLPQPVDDHAQGQRIVGTRHPLRQLRSAAGRRRPGRGACHGRLVQIRDPQKRRRYFRAFATKVAAHHVAARLEIGQPLLHRSTVRHFRGMIRLFQFYELARRRFVRLLFVGRQGLEDVVAGRLQIGILGFQSLPGGIFERLNLCRQLLEADRRCFDGSGVPGGRGRGWSLKISAGSKNARSR